MTYLQVVNLSSLLEQKKYDNFFKLLNKIYKPHSIIHLLLKIKNHIFNYEPTYSYTKNIDNKNVNLVLSYDNFLRVESIKDELIKGHYFYFKINYPNIVSIKNNLLNITSIIKEIKINDKWVKIDSYNEDDINELLLYLDLDDKKILEEQYNYYISKLEKMFFINLYNIKEYLNQDVIMQFLLSNYTYNSDDLRENILQLMKTFNFSYSDFNNHSFMEISKLIKIANNIVKEEREVNNINE